MPIYEFHCADCGKSFEVLRLSASGFKAITCPSCGSANTSKDMSTFAMAAPSGGGVPMCDRTGVCATPNMPGCGSGACGL